MNIFWGYDDFVDIFWGSSQNWASLRVISWIIKYKYFMIHGHFYAIKGLFFKVKVQNWDIVLGC